MSDWLSKIDNEFRRGGLEQNPGRTRTSARRIAGIAIKELQSQPPHQLSGDDYLRALQSFANTKDLPAVVVEAAQRLQARLSHDFTSPSVDPLGDAMIIVEFVKMRVSKK